jgi:hypothetical protein
MRDRLSSLSVWGVAGYGLFGLFQLLFMKTSFNGCYSAHQATGRPELLTQHDVRVSL